MGSEIDADCSLAKLGPSHTHLCSADVGCQVIEHLLTAQPTPDGVNKLSF